MTTTDCPSGVDPEDVATWAVGGRADQSEAGSAEGPPVDLETHVPFCPACAAAAAQARASAAVTTALHTRTHTAPLEVTTAALSRIRWERHLQVVAGALAGATGRIAAAVPTYLRPTAHVAEAGPPAPERARDPSVPPPPPPSLPGGEDT